MSSTQNNVRWIRWEWCFDSLTFFFSSDTLFFFQQNMYTFVLYSYNNVNIILLIVFFFNLQYITIWIALLLFSLFDDTLLHTGRRNTTGTTCCACHRRHRYVFFFYYIYMVRTFVHSTHRRNHIYIIIKEIDPLHAQAEVSNEPLLT